MAYVAEVVGIALGLEELGYIGVQRVLLMNFLQTFLVKDLQGKLLKAEEVGQVTLLQTEAAGLRTTDLHHSSEAG